MLTQMPHLASRIAGMQDLPSWLARPKDPARSLLAPASAPYSRRACPSCTRSAGAPLPPPEPPWDGVSLTNPEPPIMSEVSWGISENVRFFVAVCRGRPSGGGNPPYSEGRQSRSDDARVADDSASGFRDEGTRGRGKTEPGLCLWVRASPIPWAWR
jgi:hypothetical protein